MTGFLLVLLSCVPTRLTGTMWYTESMSDGTEICDVVMDLADSGSGAQSGARCDGCAFRFTVLVHARQTRTSQQCMATLPFFTDQPDQGQRPTGSFELQADVGTLTFFDKAYAYNYQGYEHPRSPADETYEQVMGADRPGTHFTRRFGRLDFGWVDTGVGDGAVGVLTGEATVR